MNNLEILKYIQSKNKELSLQGDMLSFSTYQLNTSSDILSFDTENLTLKVDIARVNNNNGIYVAQLIFIVSHPLFDTDLIESVAGIGKTEDSAILDGTDKFCINVLMTIISTFKCEGDNALEYNILGEKRIFHRNCLDNILSCGVKNPQSKPLWNLVQDIIPNYLGTKKFYWLKLFASVSGGSITCEARLNNKVYDSLSKPLNDYVKSWSNKKDYHTEKQYILLIQDDSTYKKAPFDKATIVDYTKKVIPLFENIRSQKDYDTIENKIFSITNDHNLTTELKILIPEIYCKVALQLNDQVDDNIILIQNDNQINIHTSQMRSYDYIEETIIDHMYYDRPPKDNIMNAISCSATFSSINNATSQGSNIKDLYISGFAMFVDDSYIVW